ncbi:MAG: uracil-DNA glycosylase [Myxococcota bacterium]|nr:uracil-DNA glycosylase [Myxococcota bacterium]
MTLQKEIPVAWRPLLRKEIEQPYFKTLEQTLAKERKRVPIYPPPKDVFNAFRYCSPDSCKLLLLGQDPYHGPGEAHGLSFSVKPGVKIPPSLRNMYKELQHDLGYPIPKHGTLTSWARQGVLLLNSVLTVEHKKAASHKSYGWIRFTDAVIRILAQRERKMVFLLWGGFAQRKQSLIDATKQVVITGTHPSPLSAHRGFWNSKPYSKVNLALQKLGYEPIRWRLDDIEPKL